MSIGEVLAQLRPEFPDTTISKLRFLEAEGLVEPRRTPSGYRKYTWDDLARLRFVLAAQRDQYLPLRVIREQLEAGALEQPRGRPALVAVDPDAPPPAPAGETSVTRSELLERSGLTDGALVEIEGLGLVPPPVAGRYGPDVLAVAEVVAALSRYGIEARHLRAFRASADREVGLFAQVIAPLARPGDPAAQARVAEAVRELAGLSQRLHGALVRLGLRDSLRR
ncbi:transcriptional regulator FtsR [Rhizomonospora bruguierae]|uniref:transcriptional regulator FtsR n=1 Tax=Rhizomonospora bruguierae TaxID=1581705 RepID=UPI001BCDD660|nr:MerR family transcriptional regulator [Micromonospora sp. NBRC 107566]